MHTSWNNKTKAGQKTTVFVSHTLIIRTKLTQLQRVYQQALESQTIPSEVFHKNRNSLSDGIEATGVLRQTQELSRRKGAVSTVHCLKNEKIQQQRRTTYRFNEHSFSTSTFSAWGGSEIFFGFNWQPLDSMSRFDSGSIILTQVTFRTQPSLRVEGDLDSMRIASANFNFFFIK